MSRTTFARHALRSNGAAPGSRALSLRNDFMSARYLSANTFSSGPLYRRIWRAHIACARRLLGTELADAEHHVQHRVVALGPRAERAVPRRRRLPAQVRQR